MEVKLIKSVKTRIQSSRVAKFRFQVPVCKLNRFFAETFLTVQTHDMTVMMQCTVKGNDVVIENANSVTGCI